MLRSRLGTHSGAITIAIIVKEEEEEEEEEDEEGALGVEYTGTVATLLDAIT